MVFSFGLNSGRGRRGRRPSPDENGEKGVQKRLGRVRACHGEAKRRRGPADRSEESQRKRP